jgi:nucleoside-diphosphate-sugar epimerase
MAYLITGGTGSMGVYVVRDLLKLGKEVVCLQRSGITPFLRQVVGDDKISKINIVQGDLSNTLQLFNLIKENRVDTVIHLSAVIPSGGVSEAYPDYALQVNCVGMNNILEAGRLLGLKRIVWTSSCQAFGNIGQYYKEPMGANTICAPDTMYGATKVLSEYMTKHYFERFGVDCIGLRLGFIMNVYKGMGKNGEFSHFLKNVATDVSSVMATINADHVRTLGYVENIADLIIKACMAPTTKTRTFNAVEYQVSCRQLSEAMCRVNPKAKITIKDGVADTEATWGGAQEPMVNTETIKLELGWKPKYTLEESLKQIFNFYRLQEGFFEL